MLLLAITFIASLAHIDKYYIPAGSMKPTLLVGDYLIADRYAYGLYCGWPCGGKKIWMNPPKRGDVVVFRHPVQDVDFIKRLIGMPGDRIQMKDGVLHINGQAVKTEPAGVFTETYERQGFTGNYPRCANNPAIGESCIKMMITETLPNGVSYNVLDIGDQAQDNTGVFTVPEGHYFFMGDNRDNSTDSRFPANIGGVGFVPEENLIARADTIVFSSAGASLLSFWAWRKGRYQRLVK